MISDWQQVTSTVTSAHRGWSLNNGSKMSLLLLYQHSADQQTWY